MDMERKGHRHLMKGMKKTRTGEAVYASGDIEKQNLFLDLN